MRVTIQKKTDQLNYEDFLGGVTRMVTVAGVKVGTKEQQYDIAIEGDQRVWRPAVTVLKLLVDAWQDETVEWIGRRAVLYGDPEVKFAQVKVGGIRVSHLSHIDGTRQVMLTETRAKRALHTVHELTAEAQVAYLRADWKTADPERKAAIEAEVKKLSGEVTK